MKRALSARCRHNIIIRYFSEYTTHYVKNMISCFCKVYISIVDKVKIDRDVHETIRIIYANINLINNLRKHTCI